MARASNQDRNWEPCICLSKDLFHHLARLAGCSINLSEPTGEMEGILRLSSTSSIRFFSDLSTLPSDKAIC